MLNDACPSNRYLSLLARQRIATLRGQVLGVREIAPSQERSPSTVRRELRRNVRPHDRSYDADLAYACIRERSRCPRRCRIFANVEFRDEVQCMLAWSPAQIAHYLRHDYLERPFWHLWHEAIY